MSDKIVEPFILIREFHAPRQLVFEAWTQLEHLKHWMFPQSGWTNEYVSVDIRAGGSDHYKMISPNGHEMWMLTKYEEINEPESLVFRQYMSNEVGDILPNPMMPNWPKEMMTTVILEEANGKTKLKLIWQPIHPTQAEADCFENARLQHGKGWSGGFDQLTTYLKTL